MDVEKLSSLSGFNLHMKWACLGATAVTFVIIYHKWYTRKMQNVFDKEKIMRSYREMEKWGLDYGSCLADCYFHGYVKIILPPGTQNPGFVDRVRDYQNEHQLKNCIFPQKLFVIVHKTGFSPDTYEAPQYSRFRSRKKMEFKVEGRSGIRDRSYQTPVYKVYSSDDTEHITVVMEGAPCLRQLYESAKENQALKELSGSIIETFMEKMREKIDNNQYCKGACELIYLDDGPESALTGSGGYDWLANELFRRAKLDPKRYGFH